MMLMEENNLEDLPQLVLNANTSGKVKQGEETVDFINNVNWYFMDKFNATDILMSGITIRFSIAVEDQANLAVSSWFVNLEHVDYGGNRIHRTLEGLVMSFPFIKDPTKPLSAANVRFVGLQLRLSTKPSPWLLEHIQELNN